MRDYEPYITEDGSIGLYSYADKDVFHSKFGALTEAWEKFILPANIDLNNYQQLKVLDICYGIGYNTKALMTFLINKLNSKKNKNVTNNNNNDTIHAYKNILEEKELSTYSESISANKDSSRFVIDCLEINNELVKLSPLLKTIKTPEEIFENIVPSIFNCFDSYYELKKIFIHVLSKFAYHNKKEIMDLLDLKFKDMHIAKEYKLHKYVSYILINTLTDFYKHKYLDKNFKNLLARSKNKRFIDKTMLRYIKFNDIIGYNYNKNSFLSAFLHNIYYSTLSIRDNNIKFKDIESLFKVRFHVQDARKTILELNDHYDLIFLDAFTYTKAPQLWSVEFIAELYNKIQPKGLLLTYSTSAQVRKTLLDNKFYVGKIYDIKTERIIGTVASKDKSRIEYPLNNFEIGLCNTKAGIPYHDPNLKFSNKEIIELREYEFKHSNLMSSSQYMKSRSKKQNEEEI